MEDYNSFRIVILSEVSFVLKSGFESKKTLIIDYTIHRMHLLFGVLQLLFNH